MTNIMQVTKNISSVSNDVSWELTISVVALVIAVLAVLLAVCLYLKLKRYITDNSVVDNYGHKPQRIRDLIVAVVVKSSRINKYITKKCCEAVHSQSGNGEISTIMYNDIVANVVRQVEKKYRITLRSISII